MEGERYSEDDCLSSVQTTASNEAGFSIVTVLFVMGISLTIIAAISQHQFNAMSLQKTIKNKSAYLDVDKAIVDALVNQITLSLKATAPCLETTDLISNIDGATGLVLDSSSVGFKYLTNVSFDSGRPPAFVNLETRCSAPRFPSDPLSPTNSSFYFCIQIAKDNDANKDSILKAKYFYAEVLVNLIDVQTQQPISCSDFKLRKDDAEDGSPGLNLVVGLFWQTQTGASPTPVFAKNVENYISSIKNIRP